MKSALKSLTASQGDRLVDLAPSQKRGTAVRFRRKALLIPKWNVNIDMAPVMQGCLMVSALAVGLLLK